MPYLENHELSIVLKTTVPLSPLIHLAIFSLNLNGQTITKHSVAGTVQSAVPCKVFNNFSSTTITTGIKLNDYVMYCTSIKTELMRKSIILNFIDNIE